MVHATIISLDGRDVSYTVRHYPRQKRINIHIRDDVIFITAPKRTTQGGIENAIKKNAVWILTHLSEKPTAKNVTIEPSTVRFAKKELLHYITTKIEEYNKHYQYSYNRISIRAQRSRWGSCSSDGNITFNIALLGVPRHLRDYVIVHELCHLKEMNHSAQFWALVAETIPAYKTCRQELKSHSV